MALKKSVFVCIEIICCFLFVLFLFLAYWYAEKPGAQAADVSTYSAATCHYLGDPSCSQTIKDKVAATGAWCPMQQNRAPIYNGGLGGLTNCSRYRDNACCRMEEVESHFEYLEPLYGADWNCRAYMVDSACHICSPAQLIFYDPHKESVSLCTDSCSKYYAACAHAYEGSVRVGVKYSSSQEFCEARHFKLAMTNCLSLTNDQHLEWRMKADEDDGGHYTWAISAASPSHQVSITSMLMPVMALAATGTRSPLALSLAAALGLGLRHGVDAGSGCANSDNSPTKQFSPFLFNNHMDQSPRNTSCSMFPGTVSTSRTLPNCTMMNDNNCCPNSMVSAAFELLPRLQPIPNLTCTDECDSSPGKVSINDVGACDEMGDDDVVVADTEYQECLEYMNYMQCYMCSPEQSSWFGRHEAGKVSICEHFCLQTWRYCQHMGVALPPGSNDPTLSVVIQDQKTVTGRHKRVTYRRPMTIRELFPDTSREVQDGHIKMCERQGFHVHRNFKGDDDTTNNAQQQLGHDPQCFQPACNHFECKSMPNSAPRRLAATTLWSLFPAAALWQAGSRAPSLMLVLGAAWLQTSSAVVPDSTVIGSLTAGQVRGWASAVGSYLTELSNSALRWNETQDVFDGLATSTATINGTTRFAKVHAELAGYFSERINSIKLSAAAAEANYASVATPTAEPFSYDCRSQTQPKSFDGRFKQNVSWAEGCNMVSGDAQHSMINNEAERAKIWKDIAWTKTMDATWKLNKANTSSISWQYLGTEHGAFRMYPGYEHSSNVAGMYNDYDPRFRPWFLAAESGPKDVVIVLDCSISMMRNWQQAKKLAVYFLKSFTKDDHISLICARGGGIYKHYGYSGHSGGTLGDNGHGRECRNGFWYTDSDELTCKQGNLVAATSTHIREIRARLEGAPPSGGGDLSNGIRMAYDLLDNHGNPNCQQFVILVTDDFLWDAEGNGGARTGPSYQRCHHCGDNGQCCWVCHAGAAFYSRNEQALSSIQSRANGGKETKMFSYSVSKREDIWSMPDNVGSESGQGIMSWEPSTFSSQAACASGGQKTWVNEDQSQSLRMRMRNYFRYLQRSSGLRRGVSATSSMYVDAFGLGLMISIMMPVYDASNTFLGVVATDIPLQEMEQVVRLAFAHDVNTFIIDKKSKAVIHPRIHTSDEMVDDPMLVNIKDLEQYYPPTGGVGQPTQFLDVLTAMTNNEYGEQTIADAKRFMQEGDVNDGVLWYNGRSHYYYAPIPDSDFVFAFNLADHDLLHAEINLPTWTCASPFTCWTLTGLFGGADLATIGVPNLVITVDGNHGVEPTVAESPTAPGQGISSFFLAARCFCHPEARLEQLPSIPSGAVIQAQYTEATMNTTSFANGECGNTPTAWAHASSFIDVRATNPLTNVWNNRDTTTKSQVVWTYFGTARGVTRLIPAARVPINYDPLRRVWYRKALVNPHSLTVSPVYLDAFGSGKVVSLSKPVYQQKPTACQAVDTQTLQYTLAQQQGITLNGPGCACASSSHCEGTCYDGTCSNANVEGVASTDLTYSTLNSQVLARASTGTVGCGQGNTKCYIVDDHSHIVFDSSMESVEVGNTREYDHVGLGYKEGGVMRHLTYTHKFYSRTDTTDYQGKCRVTPFSEAVRLDGIALTAGERDDYDKFKGRFPVISDTTGCIQDVINFQVNKTALTSAGGILTGSAADPCGDSGDYVLTEIPGTNTYLIVIQGWTKEKEKLPFNWGCHISRLSQDVGAYKIVNGSCVDKDDAVYPQATCSAYTAYTVEDCEGTTNSASSIVPSAMLLGLMGIALGSVGM